MMMVVVMVMVTMLVAAVLRLGRQDLASRVGGSGNGMLGVVLARAKDEDSVGFSAARSGGPVLVRGVVGGGASLDASRAQNIAARRERRNERQAVLHEWVAVDV